MPLQNRVTPFSTIDAVPHRGLFMGSRYFLASETGDLIIANLTPNGYEELSRAKLLEPTGFAFNRDVVWSHPAFANRCVFARNDKQLTCVSLAKSK